MELVAGTFVILTFVAIVVRFTFRDAAGQVRLPTIVDNSIGMWVLREVTGRPLGRSPDLDPVDPFVPFRRPSTVLAPRVDPRFHLAPWPGRATLRLATTLDPLGASFEPAWWTARPAAGGGGRSSGSPFLPVVVPELARRRSRLGLRPSWVAGAAAFGLIMGAALGLVTR
jgi:hypothetical protein